MVSWRKAVTCLLVAIIIVVMVFLLWTNANFYYQLQKSTLEADRSTIALWTENTELRLSTVHEHIRELLITIYNNTSVFSGSDPMPLEVRNKCQTSLDDKLNVSQDADCFFIMSEEDDWMLFSAKSMLRRDIIVQLKVFCQSHSGDYLTGVTSDRWFITTLDSEPCFIKCISLGKYVVGSVCRASSFNIPSVSGEAYSDVSLLVNAEGETYYLGGGTDASGELSIGSDGEPLAGGKMNAVSVGFPLVNGVTVLAMTRRPFAVYAGIWPAVTLFLSSVLCLGLIILLGVLINRLIVEPTAELLAAQKQIRDGNIRYRIDKKAGSSEFEMLYSSFNTMAEQIQHLRIEAYDRLIRDQENRLRMVRAQIRPHFYLNAITTVSNMTYQNRPEDIRTYLQALAKYMRYMMDVRSQWITVGEELGNIANYVTMQELRFPGSVHVETACSDEARRVEIPYLILFTMVENSFKHALNLYKPLELTIRCGLEDGGCLISVEDNGDGFPQDVLEEFGAEPEETSLPPTEHLGLSNIRFTLRFIYKRSDLLRLSNTENGARTEILIPLEEERNETLDM